MATIGQALTSPEVGWKRINSHDSMITYEGSWSSVSSNSYYAGNCKYTLTPGSMARFNFIGTQIRLTGYTLSPAATAVEVTIDGITTTVSQVYSGGGYQGLWFEKLDLMNGEHVVTVEKTENNTQYVYLDAIDINETGELMPFNPNIVPAPTNLTATASDTQVNLSWDAVTNVTGYNVKRSTTAGGPYTTIAANVSTNSYVDTDVVNGTIYYYVVTAVTTDGEGANSNEASATPAAPPIDVKPALLRVTVIDSSEREYQLTTTEIDGFITWFNNHTSSDTTSYMLAKKIGLQSSKEYLAFDKIISFEVIPLAE